MAKWTTQSTHQDLAAFSDDPQVKAQLRKRLRRIVVLLLLIGGVLAFTAKPVYLWFRNSQLDRNLEKAQAAARLEDWGTARNLARSVLIARPGNFEAFRVWYQALAHMGESRTYMVAATLFVDSRASREDRLDALGVMARQAPQAVALGAYASLDKEMREEPAALAAMSPLLVLRGENALIEKVLRAVHDLQTQPRLQLELLRSLCSRPTVERVAEARKIFAGLVAANASKPGLEALLILGETPGGLAPGEPLPPLAEWVKAQPKAGTLHHLIALHPAIEASKQGADAIFKEAVGRFLDLDPGTLGTWLIRHNRSAEAADLLAEPAKASPSAYIAHLHALLREKRSAEIVKALEEPPMSCDLVDLELVKAAAARFRKDAPAETNAWNQALANAAFDESRNRFLEIEKYARLLGARQVSDDAWVAGIRIGWGQIPLYRDLNPLFISLAAQSRSEDLLAVYRTLLRFEPRNPELTNNYYYLALLHEAASPATTIKALEDLIATYPHAAEYRSALAFAYLTADQPQAALGQIPSLKQSKRVSPLMCRALEATGLLLAGRTEEGSALLADMNWLDFMRCEALAFRRMLTRLELKNLPLPSIELVQPTVDPDSVPAWRKAVERLEQERARDVLPSLPAPKVPGADPPTEDLPSLPAPKIPGADRPIEELPVKDRK